MIMLVKYDIKTEQNMKAVFETLNERQKRIYAATEAAKLGYGGNKYISELLNISPKTIYNGQQELKNIDNNFTGVRRTGGGRKKIVDKEPGLKKL